MTATATLRLSGLQFRIGGLQIIKGVDLEVHAGNTLAVIGRSGSGKSSLLRCISLLNTPTGGTINLQDEVIFDSERSSHQQLRERRLARYREKIGMVFQQFNLFPHMTAEENVALSLRLVRKMDRAAVRERSMAELRSVGMADHAHKYPSELSGGQQQRVAIARAVAMDPEVILFDEPTSALDPELVGDVLEAVGRLADRGMTLVVVTHEMRFAMRIADQVVLMDEGEIIERGSPEEVLQNPRDERARRFLRSLHEG